MHATYFHFNPSRVEEHRDKGYYEVSESLGTLEERGKLADWSVGTVLN